MLAWKTNHNLSSRIFGWATSLLLLLGLIVPIYAQEDIEQLGAHLKEATGEELVQKLGANDFDVREAAEAEILTRGEEIVSLVEAACKSPDPEVRIRANDIYRQLSIRLRDERFERFLSMDKKTDLPGWKRFKEQHGDSPANRKLYVEMLRQEWELLVALEDQPHLIDYLFYQRANKMRGNFQFPNQGQGVSEGSAAAMFHAASQKDVRITQPAMEQMRFLMATPQLSGSLQDPENNKPLLSVFDHWLRANIEMGRFTSEMRFVVLATCMREHLPSGVILARKMLDDRSNPLRVEEFTQFNVGIDSDQQMMYAMLALAKLGSREDLKILKPFLDDETAIDAHLGITDRFTTQLRDVALLASLKLMGEEPKDYGFSRLATDPSFLYNVRSIGFLSQEERTAAFEKWEHTRKEETEPKPDESTAETK